MNARISFHAVLPAPPPWTRAAVAEVLRAEELNRAEDADRS
jgi:hypothetical protein